MTPGAVISRYRIVAPLGKGGMGVVYRAEDTRLQRPVALKFLPPDALEEEDRKRLYQEAQAAAQIRHPNVCPIYDVEDADGQLFIAMAYLEGEPLSRAIARGPLPVGRAIDIAIQIANGLEAAHALGIVHRDIKASNVLVGADGHVSILDFGLALRPGMDRLTKAGETSGTPAYMSPEQAQGSEIDHRTDIWSLGVLLFEMLTGKLPFRRDHHAAVLHAIVTHKPAEIGTLRAGVPDGLAGTVERALEKKPERRWQTAREFAAELKRMQEPAAATQTMVRPVARRRGVLWVGVAALAVLVAVAAVWFSKRPAPVASGKKQVAVLPFHVVGGAADAAVMSDGLLEILTAALSDFERFEGRIVAVPSSDVRARKIATAEQARQIYGVDLAITGSVQPLGKKLQFTINLIDAAAGRQVGAKNFEYDPAKPTESRDQAVDQLARLLQFDVTPTVRRTIRTGDTSTAGAYSAYLEGRGFLSRYDVEGNIERAIASFRRAVAADPKYALAWSGLGEAYWRKLRKTRDLEDARVAVENAERAVALDPGLALVHAVLGTVYGAVGREAEGIRQLQEAMQLAPANAEAPRELARIYTKLGRYDEAEALYKKAIEARPTDSVAYTLLAYYYDGRERYDEAATAYRRAMELAPENFNSYRNLGIVELQQGRYQEALVHLQRSLQLRQSAGAYNSLGLTYYYLQRFQEAVSAAETAIDLDPLLYYCWGNLGIYVKHVAGAEQRSEPSLRKAIALAEEQIKRRPKEYGILADLAEYRARVGDRKAALADIERIPKEAQQPLLGRLAIAYEFTGQRQKAVQLLRERSANRASLNQIKDDPDLRGLWQALQ